MVYTIWANKCAILVTILIIIANGMVKIKSQLPKDIPREEICCFTGHRAIRLQDKPYIGDVLEHHIIRLIEQGVRVFLAGGALGFDTLAAQMVLKLKPRYPHIELRLILPCRDQTRGWSVIQKNNYRHILGQADQVMYLSERYYPGCMQMRNRYLVDHSAYCICYCVRSRGGTAYTVEYARQNGLEIVNVIE